MRSETERLIRVYYERFNAGDKSDTYKPLVFWLKKL